MEGGAWWATVHGVAKSRTQLSDFTSWYRKLIGIENILIFVHYLLSSLFHCFIDCFGFSK